MVTLHSQDLPLLQMQQKPWKSARTLSGLLSPLSPAKDLDQTLPAPYYTFNVSRAHRSRLDDARVASHPARKPRQL